MYAGFTGSKLYIFVLCDFPHVKQKFVHNVLCLWMSVNSLHATYQLQSHKVSAKIIIDNFYLEIKVEDTILEAKTEDGQEEASIRVLTNVTQGQDIRPVVRKQQGSLFVCLYVYV